MKKLLKKIESIASISPTIPGVIIIHGLPKLDILYISDSGLSLLQKTREEIDAMSPEEFQTKFFNEHHATEVTPKIVDLLNRNTNETASYFQQVRTSPTNEWDWYMSTTKVFMRDESNLPVAVITIAMQIDRDHYFTAKAARLLEENLFIKHHYHEFDSLTNRERSVLKLLAAGKSSPQIANELNISPTTVETHRKRIRQKLNARNSHELAQYARAFDLI